MATHTPPLKLSPSPPSAASAGSAKEPLCLGTAINMAAAAFQAYQEPTRGSLAVKRGQNGTTTQFLNQDFVLEHYPALLKVTVQRAAGDLDADLFSKPDLYVQVSVGDSYASTQKQSNTDSPEWAETLLLWPPADAFGNGTAQPILVVRLFDSDLVSDDFVALGAMELEQEWEHKGSRNVTLELHKPEQPDKGVGAIHLTLQPLGFTEEARVASAALTSADAEAQSLEEATAAFVLYDVANPGVRLASAAPPASIDASAAFALSPDALAALSRSPDAAAAPIPASDSAAPADIPLLDAAHEGTEVQGSNDRDKKKEAADLALRRAWVAMSNVCPGEFLLGAQPLAFVASKETDTTVWVQRNVRLKQTVVSFCGSESGHDWVRTNANAVREPFIVDEALGGLPDAAAGPPGAQGGGLNLETLETLSKPTVHAGFLRAWRSVAPQVKPLVRMSARGEAGWKVTMTGHSLGAALATLGAYALAKPKHLGQDVECYTVASTVVGDRRFSQDFLRAVPKSFRTYNTLDPAANIPLVFGYTYVKYPCRLIEGGTIALPDGNPVNLFSGENLPPEVLRDLVKAPGFEDSNFHIVLGLLQSLFSKEGIARGHNKHEYLETLAEVMVTASANQRPEVQKAVAQVRRALQMYREANFSKAQEENS